ncbi:RHS repeat-associated core domain-containing protein [Pseudomonas putida]|uniref:RHS repeat-associated core domain-containing protein n=1 Tax=Pseudomonas putida TaxID=303 RepID=UPI00235B92CC|nr:RHS repeat-associated core domain-containing protein [Pseudomonas putida]GLO47036.1 hypothetical protein PPUN109347_35990 [Pseudomonas putida]HDS0979209.1 RHS repeat-associated core domain-containing protein [Pseudomonas putida]
MSTSQKAHYFYSPEGLALVMHAGEGVSALMRAAGQALAQCDDRQAAFYTADKQGSVLQYASCSLRYSVYGFDACQQRASELRFSGQRKNLATGHYLLGEGYRAFVSTLMRFTAPDSLSPFGLGGINCYSYCSGDPVNRIDPSGHAGGLIDFAKQIASVIGNKFGDILAYQGRDTGKWIDELRTRTKFSPQDLPVMEGAGASATRDVYKLHADMMMDPPESKADVRFVAATRLVEAVEQIQFLETRAKASMERDKVRSNWFEPPKKSG